MSVANPIRTELFKYFCKLKRPLPRNRLDVGQKTAIDFVSLIIDNSLFDKEGYMGFEAMTQAIESFRAGDYEEEFTGDPALGLFMDAYERGKGHLELERNMALTEYVLFNAGYDELAKQFRKYAEAELKNPPPEE